ncbi:unnamed protein product [Arabidopsis lyrata]|nr:unnamed protein product [Arabidopsis lyrata]
MMLRILGVNGLVDEFWGLVDVMKKKGHGLSANVRDKVGEKFQKDGLESDLVRLRKLFASDCLDNSAENVCDRVCKIVMKEEWGDDVEKRVRDLNVEFKSDLVKMIVESLDVEPRKALLFFRWIDESGLFKHDEKTYNAMAKIRDLGFNKKKESITKIDSQPTPLVANLNQSELDTFLDRNSFRDWARGMVLPMAWTCCFSIIVHSAARNQRNPFGSWATSPSGERIFLGESLLASVLLAWHASLAGDQVFSLFKTPVPDVGTSESSAR